VALNKMLTLARFFSELKLCLAKSHFSGKKFVVLMLTQLLLEADTLIFGKELGDLWYFLLPLHKE